MGSADAAPTGLGSAQGWRGLAKGSGTVFYKKYGPQPSRALGYYASGRFGGHKRDHEMWTHHCGGMNDDDCEEEVYLTNKSGTRAFADNICVQRGFCPDASFVTPGGLRGRPFCGITASPHQSKVRNECYYVYGNGGGGGPHA